MIVVVSDACLLIDLVDAGIVDEFFILDIEPHVNPLILEEVDDEQRPLFDRPELANDTLSEKQLADAESLRTHRPALSITDCTAFVQARDLRAVLLTGDGKLRSEAGAGLTVHGTLWIFDEMVRQQVLTRRRARAALIQLSEKNPRLPRGEVTKRLREWEQE